MLYKDLYIYLTWNTSSGYFTAVIKCTGGENKRQQHSTGYENENALSSVLEDQAAKCLPVSHLGCGAGAPARCPVPEPPSGSPAAAAVPPGSAAGSPSA